MNRQKQFKGIYKRVHSFNFAIKIFVNHVNMKTEDKGSLPRLRIAVLGNKNVGKSALTVRYLTKRYIGEYRSNTDLLYRQFVTVNNIQQEVEIVDVCCDDSAMSSSGECVPQQQQQIVEENNDSLQNQIPEEPLYWADACIVAYSVTEKKSLTYATQVLDRLSQIRTQVPISVALVGNKADLEHLREVAELEGRTIAVQHNCAFYEVSVADNSPSLYQMFESLITECRAQQQSTHKTRKFSVSKMLGNLIGNGKTTQQQVPQGGTLVVCQKSDLHKSRVLKRRQNFLATVSL